MQATDLGRYLLYGKDARLPRLRHAAGRRPAVDPAAPDGEGRAARQARAERDGAERLGRLARRGRGRRLHDHAARRRAARWRRRRRAARLVPTGAAGRFTFEPATGCAVYPEAETNVTGPPTKGPTAYGEVVGPRRRPHAHDGLRVPRRPGPLRPPVASASARPPRWSTAPTTSPAARARSCENALSYGNPLGTHDTRRLADAQGLAAPRLADPRAELLQVARARLARRPAGVREPARRQRGPVRRSIRSSRTAATRWTPCGCRRTRIRQLQDYIDAQTGGPGKGWFRIVTDPVRRRAG